MHGEQNIKVLYMISLY